MRQGPNNNKRMRGRGNNSGRKHSNSRNHSFESNGPDVKVRGNAQQIVEKYLTLARDATSAGDRINAESYYQFAEHYYRVLNANNANDQRQNTPNADTGDMDAAQDGGDQPAAVEASSGDQDVEGAKQDHGGENGSGGQNGSGGRTGGSRRRNSRSRKDAADAPQPQTEAASPEKSVSEEAAPEETGEGANA